MNRLEALHILGLDEDATSEDIKTAYRETVQILHPDRFAGNKKLEERATEQFKRLQEAYEYLTSSKAKRRATRSSGASSKTAGSGKAGTRGGNAEDYIGKERTIRAKLAGIAAARAQLVAQRDTLMDERRNGLLMLVIGGLVAILTIRRPFGLLGVIASIATVAAVWGIVTLVSSQRTINTLEEHLALLKKQEQQLIKQLEDLET